MSISINKIRMIERLQNAKTFWEDRQKTRKKVEKKYRGFTGWLYAITDLHEPFTRHDLVSKILKSVKYAKSEIITVLGGDTLTLDLFSKFVERRHPSATLEREINNAVDIINAFCDASKGVIMLAANHETRYFKDMIRRIGQNKADQLQSIGMSIIEQIKDRVTSGNLDVVDEWFVRIGGSQGAIVAHPHINSAVAGRAGMWLCDYLAPRIDFRVAFCGHTHRCAKMPYKRRLVVQTGYLSKMFDYGRKARIGALSRGDLFHLGYGYGYINKGIADINRSDFKILGWEEGL